MKLALRHTLPKDSSILIRFVDALSKFILHTRWGHSGLVIDNTIYHATARHGLIKEEFDPEGWDVFDLGSERDAYLIDLFLWRQKTKQTKYDWFSLLAFTVLGLLFKRITDSGRVYCHEWCYEVMTRRQPTTKVTPETLLKEYIEKKLT
jgi:hypothetical protein